MCVYLLHFDRPVSPRHTCQHYLGWCLDVEARLAEHLAGRGSRLTQVALERGIGFVVVRIWPHGNRTFERRLKNRKESPRLCPLCAPGLSARLARVDAGQLELPLDDFPVPPPLLMDGHEAWRLGAWRAARPRPAPAGGEWDAGLL